MSGLPRTAAEVGAAHLKERIYATISMLAVVVGLTEWKDTDPGDAAAAVVVTALGLWLASLVADEQAHRALNGRAATRGELSRMLYVSSPLMLSAVGPVVMIGASMLGLLDLDVALLVAAGVEVVSLFAWGYVGGLRMGSRRSLALIAGVLDTAIGLLVAAVKLVAGH